VPPVGVAGPATQEQWGVSNAVLPDADVPAEHDRIHGPDDRSSTASMAIGGDAAPPDIRCSGR
jgi:hypothetical protein